MIASSRGRGRLRSPLASGSHGYTICALARLSGVPARIPAPDSAHPRASPIGGSVYLRAPQDLSCGRTREDCGARIGRDIPAWQKIKSGFSSSPACAVGAIPPCSGALALPPLPPPWPLRCPLSPPAPGRSRFGIAGIFFTPGFWMSLPLPTPMSTVPASRLWTAPLQGLLGLVATTATAGRVLFVTNSYSAVVFCVREQGGKGEDEWASNPSASENKAEKEKERKKQHAHKSRNRRRAAYSPPPPGTGNKDGKGEHHDGIKKKSD